MSDSCGHWEQAIALEGPSQGRKREGRAQDLALPGEEDGYRIAIACGQRHVHIYVDRSKRDAQSFQVARYNFT
jgi:hypothetical protein